MEEINIKYKMQPFGLSLSVGSKVKALSMEILHVDSPIQSDTYSDEEMGYTRISPEPVLMKYKRTAYEFIEEIKKLNTDIAS